MQCLCEVEQWSNRFSTMQESRGCWSPIGAPLSGSQAPLPARPRAVACNPRYLQRTHLAIPETLQCYRQTKAPVYSKLNIDIE
ncbi:unnamed protein product [Pieris macdunnoughi]|uniref:Uncharacterized protein n=1 Tax=Pieris macdunnoughi TaxID=345717 RepID=A0A821WEY5_9NEOP|nr:unnamed protein product [Pieris macdunnoughi]